MSKRVLESEPHSPTSTVKKNPKRVCILRDLSTTTRDVLDLTTEGHEIICDPSKKIQTVPTIYSHDEVVHVSKLENGSRSTPGDPSPSTSSFQQICDTHLSTTVLHPTLRYRRSYNSMSLPINQVQVGSPTLTCNHILQYDNNYSSSIIPHTCSDMTMGHGTISQNQDGKQGKVEGLVKTVDAKYTMVYPGFMRHGMNRVVSSLRYIWQVRMADISVLHLVIYTVYLFGLLLITDLMWVIIYLATHVPTKK